MKASLDSPQVTSDTAKPRWWRAAVRKGVEVVAVGVLCAVFYSWAAARWYSGAEAAGFFRGMVHGAAMPMALPALLGGADPPIYAANNTGRSYKLGYIAGINACGLIVFGVLFRKTTPKKS